MIAAGWDGVVRGLIVVADAAKPTSAAAVAELTALGLRPVLLTGDNAATAAAIAAEVGIAEVIADVLPAEKADVIRRLQAEGRVVAMVGDGVNDAPALAQADLGLAIGTGTDVAIEASDITLVSGDLLASADAIRLSRRTLTTIKGNLFWAFGYNVAALPLAAAGYLNPLIAGAAMAGSSLFVVANSLRLRRFQPHREARHMSAKNVNPGYIGDKDALSARLKRIEGQVRGIERMVEDERYCIDILTQISAIQAALDKVGLRLLEQHAAHCVIGPEDAEVRAEKTGEMMAAVARLMGRS